MVYSNSTEKLPYEQTTTKKYTHGHQLFLEIKTKAKKKIK
jgi:hypothetical protein